MGTETDFSYVRSIPTDSFTLLRLADATMRPLTTTLSFPEHLGALGIG